MGVWYTEEDDDMLGDGTNPNTASSMEAERKAKYMKNIKVSNIEIEIGSRTVQLSLKEAKELQEVLNNTFPETTAPMVIEKWVDKFEKPYRPYWHGISDPPYPLTAKPIICSSSGSTLKSEGDTVKYSLSC